MDTFNMNIGWLPLKTLLEFDILFRKYVENIVEDIIGRQREHGQI